MQFETQLLFALEKLFVAEGEQCSGNRVAIPFGKPDGEVCQEVHVTRCECTDHTAIDKGHNVIGHDEDIAGMRIRMEKTVSKNHL